ncbi:MAG: sel1 repeat family protein [Ignavibacteria bacterium]|nr:sel1 repeat family protein [Ignavibacteria bacterium]
MRKLLLLLLIVCTCTAGSFAQSRSARKTQDTLVESLAHRNKNWWMSLYHLYIPEYSYKFQALFYLVQKANSGDAFAQHELGLRYMLGDGFETDTVKALYWIRKAAEQDLPAALYNLGVFYNSGNMGEWNPFIAYNFYRRAASYGMTDAEYAMGLYYLDNMVLPRNTDSAFVWIKRAAGKGFTPAIEVLRRMREIYMEPEIKSATGADTKEQKYVFDRSQVVKTSPAQLGMPGMEILELTKDTSSLPSDSAFFMRALKANGSETKYNLGLIGIDSLELTPPAEILQKLHFAALAGSPEANLYLGRFFEKGIYVPRHNIKALMYYLRALRLESSLAGISISRLIDHKNVLSEMYALAEKKDPDALFSFAMLNALGYNTLLSEDKLVKFLDEAAQKGHLPSLLELGQCYFTGTPIKADREKAYSYWLRAGKAGSAEGLLRLSIARLLTTGECGQVMPLETVKMADSSGSVLAEVLLGYMYEKGLCVSMSKREAVRYYRQASYRGSNAASSSIRRMLDELRPKDSIFIKPNEEK